MFFAPVSDVLMFNKLQCLKIIPSNCRSISSCSISSCIWYNFSVYVSVVYTPSSSQNALLCWELYMTLTLQKLKSYCTFSNEHHKILVYPFIFYFVFVACSRLGTVFFFLLFLLLLKVRDGIWKLRIIFLFVLFMYMLKHCWNKQHATDKISIINQDLKS